MSKKSLPGGLAEDAAWREGDDGELPQEATGNLSPLKPVKATGGKPSRQRIEEYFERKRLAEALQEELGEDLFRD
ncbi:MAG: hypothetical protein ACT4NU_04740 [Chromatiales bacterium]